VYDGSKKVNKWVKKNIPGPDEMVVNSITKEMPKYGYTDDQIVGFRCWVYGPTADPNNYTADGRYIGPDLMIGPPILGEPCPEAPKGGGGFRLRPKTQIALRSIPSLIEEAAELGIGIERLEIEGQVARIRISQTFTNSTEDFARFGRTLRQQGVRQVVVDTGPVVARELAARYRSIAAKGGTIRGGGRAIASNFP
jgi:hypothetical protein